MFDKMLGLGEGVGMKRTPLGKGLGREFQRRAEQSADVRGTLMAENERLREENSMLRALLVEREDRRPRGAFEETRDRLIYGPIVR
jgi:hypothetical protein